MGRNTKLTKDVTKTITEIYEKHPDWSVRDIQKKIPEFNRKLLRSEVPGRTTINKYIREVLKPNSEKIRESKEPWNMGTLSNYALPPESLHLIVKAQVDMRRLNKPITNDEAVWMSRLAPIIKSTELLDREWVVYAWAAKYALAERIALLTGRQLDTSEFDDVIISYPEEYVAYPFLFNLLRERKGLLFAGERVGFYIFCGMYIKHLEQKQDKDEKTLGEIEECRYFIQEAERYEKKATELEDKRQAISDSQLESLSKKSPKMKKIKERLESIIKEALNER